MYIRLIKLKNFRNYESLELRPCEGVTVLMGDNAQGKTNALEAVYMTCTGRSHRTRQDIDLILRDRDMASVYVESERRDGSHEVEIIIPAYGRRVVKVAGQKTAKSGELMGHVTGVLFSPEDLTLIKDGPSERRRFLDMAISQLKPSYYYALQRYARALKQRNELLKQRIYLTLDEFDEQLSVSGAEIMRVRKWYVELLSDRASITHGEISGKRENLRLEYKAGSSEDMKKALLEARETDIRRLTTTVGAHRDDVRILIDGSDARSFGSQGQQRTAALSLRLSELSVMRDELGEWPILMLDDVMSELDPERRRRLVKRLSGVQTIITCTDKEDLSGAEIGAMYRVDNAKMTIIE